MKVVLTSAWFPPDTIGGTENYVQALATGLQSVGVEVLVMAPQQSGSADQYTYDGIRVRRYPDPTAAGVGDGEARRGQPDVFAALLRTEAPDVYHQHSLTPACGLEHLAIARALGASTITTLHLPDVVCMRGTMMRFGAEPCDGRIIVQRCGACWLHSKGLPRTVAKVAATILQVSGASSGGRTKGRLGTACRAPELAHERVASVHNMAELSDRIVAVSAWLFASLLANGVQREKLRCVRQSVSCETIQSQPRRRHERTSLRVGFFGRATWVKGLDTLLSAMRHIPAQQRIEIFMHLVGDAAEDASYRRRVLSLAERDSRVHILAPVAPGSVRRAMRDYDIVAVPSRWLETGPLVAMEAVSAGVPVLGSDLGGIAELVEPGVTGWLLPPDRPREWAAKLESLANGEVANLRPESRRVKLVSHLELAEQMATLYAEVVSSKRNLVGS